MKPGDLMCFHNEDGSVGHASVISSVTNNEIYYAGNTKRRFDSSLSKVLESSDFAGVYVVRIKGEQ